MIRPDTDEINQPGIAPGNRRLKSAPIARKARVSTAINNMGHTVDEMLKALSAAQRAAVQCRAGELIAEELALRDLRKSPNPPQCYELQSKRGLRGRAVASK